MAATQAASPSATASATSGAVSAAGATAAAGGATPSATAAGDAGSAGTTPPTTPTTPAAQGSPSVAATAAKAPVRTIVAGVPANAPIQKLFVTASPSPAEKALLDIDNPASILVLVNKRRHLEPADYLPADLLNPRFAMASGEPAQLRAEAAGAVERMFSAAAADGVAMTILSGFRSYQTQVGLYNGYVAQKGVEQADTSSARPGFSEHQTGLALDIGDANAGPDCAFTYCMAESAAGKWVAAHAADYGFIVRYQLDFQAVTGYLAEPWHLRYVGVRVARDMAARGFHSYEEYLGMPAAPGY
ncbi:hypothetical protein AL755_18560 [Arthrobacter sp. ERGS1:01]|nr:hypothetical protein AL755_18560 [Arthrobacter sp. ERGS1:01]